MRFSYFVVLFLFSLTILPNLILAGENRQQLLQQQTAATFANRGNSLIVEARSTGNGDLYVEARMEFEKSLEISPKNTTSLNGLGLIALNGHQFARARAYAEQSLAINEFQPTAYGVLIDALIELGNYGAALQAAEKMLEIRPDNAALTRVSYLRELHGDLDGAIAALEKAGQFGFDTREARSWCLMQTGKLHLLKGDPAAAEKCFRQALKLHPKSGQAASGLAQALAARGNKYEALNFALLAVETEPIGETKVKLAELYLHCGFQRLATEEIERTIRLIREEKAGGMDVDDELAALLSDWDIDQQEALQLVKSAYARRPTVNIAHLRAKILYRLGDFSAAAISAAESMRLATQYPHFYYWSGKSNFATGNYSLAAEHLQTALDLNPYITFAQKRDIEQMLASIQSR